MRTLELEVQWRENSFPIQMIADRSPCVCATKNTAREVFTIALYVRHRKEMKIVTHLAIKHEPHPCLKFQYSKKSRSYHKTIRINTEQYLKSVNQVAAGICEKHPELRQVSTPKLVDMIGRLGKSKCDDGNNNFISPIRTSDRIKRQTKRYEDLNHATDEQLTQAKYEMNLLFEQTVISPCDARYEYDKRIEFHADDESSNSWDE